MPERSKVGHAMGTELYSIEIYDQRYFEAFNPNAVFEKWAAVEVSSFDSLPHDMETLVVPEGEYAVFIHTGLASNVGDTYRFILQQWLPPSDYHLDTRPHLGVMGEKYRPGDPKSEEALWIPVRRK